MPAAIPSAWQASWLLAYMRATRSIRSLAIFSITSLLFGCTFSVRVFNSDCRAKKKGCKLCFRACSLVDDFRKKNRRRKPYGREESVRFSNLRVCLGLQGVGPRFGPVPSAAALHARRRAGPSRMRIQCCPDWSVRSRRAGRNGRPTSTGRTADRCLATGTDVQVGAGAQMHSGRDAGSRHVWD